MSALFLALQWGCLGGLALEGYEFKSNIIRHRAKPWEIMTDPQTGKLYKDPRSTEELRPLRRAYFITVVITAVAGAVTAACAVKSGLVINPFAEIGVGFVAERLWGAVAKNYATIFTSLIRFRVGDDSDDKKLSASTPEVPPAENSESKGAQVP